MTRRALWLGSAAVSAALLAFVLAQVDAAAARAVLGGIDVPWLGAGIALLLAEGLVTAARFRLLARARPGYADCLRATAWYVLLLVGLPARLGEFAGIGAMVRFMRERAGAAAASLLFQRVFDLILLLTILGVAAAFALAGGAPVTLAAAALLSALMAGVLVMLDPILALCARPLRAHRRRPWPRRVLRLLLQARLLRRHHCTRWRVLALGAYTILKWGVNLGGIACVVMAVIPALPVATALMLGIVYNLAAVIPVQTVGGFGITEVVLLGSFRYLGYAAGVGAPLAIAIRIALVSAPLLFWLLIVPVRALWRAAMGKSEFA